MSLLFKSTVLSVAIAATLALAPAANAGERWHDRPHRSHSGNGDLLAAGILGLAAGALIVGATTQPRTRHVYERPVVYDGYRYRRPDRHYYPAAPRSGYVAYAEDLEPWSRGWFRYCSDRYRTFNPETGTYFAYGGEKRFCVAD